MSTHTAAAFSIMCFPLWPFLHAPSLTATGLVLGAGDSELYTSMRRSTQCVQLQWNTRDHEQMDGAITTVGNIEHIWCDQSIVLFPFQEKTQAAEWELYTLQFKCDQNWKWSYEHLEKLHCWIPVVPRHLRTGPLQWRQSASASLCLSSTSVNSDIQSCSNGQRHIPRNELYSRIVAVSFLCCVTELNYGFWSWWLLSQSSLYETVALK